MSSFGWLGITCAFSEPPTENEGRGNLPKHPEVTRASQSNLQLLKQFTLDKRLGEPTHGLYPPWSNTFGLQMTLITLLKKRKYKQKMKLFMSFGDINLMCNCADTELIIVHVRNN